MPMKSTARASLVSIQAVLTQRNVRIDSRHTLPIVILVVRIESTLHSIFSTNRTFAGSQVIYRGLGSPGSEVSGAPAQDQGENALSDLPTLRQKLTRFN